MTNKEQVKATANTTANINTKAEATATARTKADSLRE
jgi:hypothetical protein